MNDQQMLVTIGVIGLIVLSIIAFLVWHYGREVVERKSYNRDKKSGGIKNIIFIVKEYSGLNATITESLDEFVDYLVIKLSQVARNPNSRLAPDDYKVAKGIKRIIPQHCDICVLLNIDKGMFSIQIYSRDRGVTEYLNGIDRDPKLFKISGTSIDCLKKIDFKPIIALLITAIKGPRVSTKKRR